MDNPQIQYECPVKEDLREELTSFWQAYTEEFEHQVNRLCTRIRDWHKQLANRSIEKQGSTTFHQYIGPDLPYQLLMDLLPFRDPNAVSSDKGFRDQIVETIYGSLGNPTIEELLSLLETGSIDQCIQFRRKISLVPTDQIQHHVTTVLEDPDLQPIQMIRFLYCVKQMSTCDLWIWDTDIQNYYWIRPDQGGLHNLSQIASILRAESHFEKDKTCDYKRSIFIRYYSLEDLRWKDKDILDYISESDLSDRLNEIDHRERALWIIQKYSGVPESLVPKLWAIALGGNKTGRKAAQDCLDQLPNISQELIRGLKSRSSDEQIQAAEWLARRQESAAIGPLREVVSKTKKVSVRESMIQALENLGVNIDEYYKPEILLAEAQQELKKGIPDQLSWFPFTALPVVHWQKTQEIVNSEILTWLVIMTFRQKTIEPSSTLRRYVNQFNPRERENLGQFVLNSWIEDTPTKCKGILAICSACCGSAAVPVIQTYLKTWYGKRASQCKYLLEILAWMEDPLGIQLLLSIANRFRTQSIQKKAGMLVDQLAQRKGWTQEELADRTVPTAGFNEHGILILSYGERQFQATLDDQMNLKLINDQGKLIKSLPSPRKDEDPEQVKAAKQQLSEARKSLKQGLQLQRERLYEAMCTQRTWIFQDWDQLLYRHPLMGRYCQRLIWSVIRDNQIIQTFRPLEDGSLSDYGDEEVSMDPQVSIQISHGCLLPTEITQAWRQHLVDYEIEPLFDQFPQEIFQVPKDSSKQSIDAFMGYLVESFALRNTLTKRGYTRGPVLDAGIFYSYDKLFRSLNLTATLEFTGSYLPEESHTVAIEKITFHKLSSYTYGIPGKSLMLSQVPAVLLHEIWNDTRIAAAQGTGYDPEWKSKIEF